MASPTRPTSPKSAPSPVNQQTAAQSSASPSATKTDGVGRVTLRHLIDAYKESITPRPMPSSDEAI